MIQSVLAGAGGRGCAFLNASLELEDAEHPAVRSALEHLDARRRLVAELVAVSEIEPDEELVNELVLLIDGSFAVAASRRDPSAVSHARRAMWRNPSSVHRWKLTP